MYTVYVLYSQTFRQIYTGHSINIGVRFKRHNDGKVLSTKRYRPWKLVYTEEFPSRAEAMAREKYLKSGIGREYLRLLHLF